MAYNKFKLELKCIIIITIDIQERFRCRSPGRFVQAEFLRADMLLLQ